MDSQDRYKHFKRVIFKLQDFFIQEFKIKSLILQRNSSCDKRKGDS